MLNWFKSLFSETSDVSMTRFLSFICVLTAMLISVTAIVKGADLSATAVLVGTFLASAFTGKVVQRFAEVKENSTSQTETMKNGE